MKTVEEIRDRYVAIEQRHGKDMDDFIIGYLDALEWVLK